MNKEAALNSIREDAFIDELEKMAGAGQVVGQAARWVGRQAKATGRSFKNLYTGAKEGIHAGVMAAKNPAIKSGTAAPGQILEHSMRSGAAKAALPNSKRAIAITGLAGTGAVGYGAGRASKRDR